jgi:hypothetical protein
VLASNLYAADENWGHVVDVRVDMGVNKETASYSTRVSYIEVNGEDNGESFASTQHP